MRTGHHAWPRLAAGVLLAVLLVGVGCGNDDDDAAPTDDETTEELSGTLRVFAAASLTDAFGALALAYEDRHPGVTVETNFAGSSTLRESILAGAPADVFASANQSNMTQLVEAGEIADGAGEPHIFVRNLLEIAVPDGNPAGVTGLDDFADPDLLIGLCAEEVPCGEFGRELLEQAGVDAAPDTNEPDVRALLTKVEAGELDAGLVYRTDVRSAAGGVDGIEIAEEDNVEAAYPIAVVAGSTNPEAAAAFGELALSDEGQEVLSGFGFLRP